MKYFFLLFSLQIIFFQNSVFCQKKYAQEIITKLSSPKMKGRGYTNNGDKIAAEYIKKEFKKLNLKPFSNSYEQPFTLSTNTQSGILELKINDTLLKPGVDFLANPNNPSIKGNFEIVLIKNSDFQNTDSLKFKIANSHNKLLLIDKTTFTSANNKTTQKRDEIINYLRYTPDLPYSGLVFLTDKKLTWSASQTQHSKASFTLRKKASFSLIKSLYLNCESTFIPNYKTQNLIGYTQGLSESDSLIVITAHYDHLGEMGNLTFFPGANDNASGIAMLLNIAKYFSQPKNKPKYSIAYIAFSGEEIGLLGSKYFCEHPLFSLEKIKFLLNFDLSGTGNDGIKIVNGSIYKNHFNNIRNINTTHSLLKGAFPRGKACNSDHCYFDLHGVPSFYIYTLGGSKAYHDINDTPEKLPLTYFEKNLELNIRFIKTL